MVEKREDFEYAPGRAYWHEETVGGLSRSKASSVIG